MRPELLPRWFLVSIWHLLLPIAGILPATFLVIGIGDCGSTIDDMLSPANATEMVTNLYPNSRVVRWEHPDQGMDHLVDIAHLSTGQTLVVRRPLTQAYKEHAVIEEQILTTLASTLQSQSAIAPTLPTMVANTPDFHIQSFVPGTELDSHQWDTLSRQERMRVIHQLSEFLNTLHASSHHAETKWLQTGNTNTTDPRALPFKVELSHKRALELLYPLLSHSECESVERIFTAMEATITSLAESSLTLVHSDLYSTHLRFAGNLGIIDFSDMNMGDPAVDMQHLAEISPELLHGVCSDQEIHERALVYKRWDNIFLVIDALRRHDVAAARQLLRHTLESL